MGIFYVLTFQLDIIRWYSVSSYWVNVNLLVFQLSVTETKLHAFEEECATLHDDLSNTNMGKDELIKKAWEVRDAAVKRKNNTEIELARSRIDVMQINSQLLEAIQQKVELSQQLEQWKIDMQELLEEQV